jgi:hypothetical protein
MNLYRSRDEGAMNAGMPENESKPVMMKKVSTVEQDYTSETTGVSNSESSYATGGLEDDLARMESEVDMAVGTNQVHVLQ